MIRRRTGFTLIELLVVIAIISLLVSILLPLLQKAKEEAKKVVCMSNQRNLASAFSMYSNDYEVYPPYWVFPNGITVGGFSLSTYRQLLKPYTNDPAYSQEYKIGLEQMNHSLWRCPAKDPPHAYSTGLLYYNGAWRLDKVYTDYAYYGKLGKRQPSTITHPANTILLTDCQKPFNTQPGNFFLCRQWGPMGIDCLYTSDGFSILELRHNEGANILFVDGHVEWRGEEIPMDMLPFSDY